MGISVGYCEDLFCWSFKESDIFCHSFSVMGTRFASSAGLGHGRQLVDGVYVYMRFSDFPAVLTMRSCFSGYMAITATASCPLRVNFSLDSLSFHPPHISWHLCSFSPGTAWSPCQRERSAWWTRQHERRAWWSLQREQRAWWNLRLKLKSAKVLQLAYYYKCYIYNRSGQMRCCDSGVSCASVLLPNAHLFSLSPISHVMAICI